jgi:deazaflavin-dependent oxidoreductase (nitroreductase family)
VSPLLAELAHQPYCYVTTYGRRTGSPHEIEIWFGAHPDGGCVYLLSGGGDRSDWVKNVVADPRVRLRIGERHWETRARVVDVPDEDSLARRILAAKYQSWREGQPMSEWARTALPIAIDIL